MTVKSTVKLEILKDRLGDIDALKAKHQALEDALDEETNRPHPDEFQIALLKKQKLAIKDEIAGFGAA